MLFEMFFISRIFRPHSRSGLKLMYGNLRLVEGISSRVSFSMTFLRDVACFDFAALEANRTEAPVRDG